MRSFPGSLGVALFLFCFSINAADLPGLALAPYAGLSITGKVGAVYTIEYTPELSSTNVPPSWKALEFLQLPKNPFLWIDKSASIEGRRFYRAMTSNVPSNLVFIPPGTFMRGDPTNDPARLGRQDQRNVIVSRGFWMGKYEVTQQEYLDLIGVNPSFFNGPNGIDGGPVVDYGVDLGRPVESVTWLDTQEFCKKLTEKHRAEGLIPANSAYRLPTITEWEYAARAWRSTRFPFGEDLSFTELPKYAWYKDNADHRSHAVGQKLPNPWGLYDMQGNVWEWCQDQGTDERDPWLVDPVGKSPNGHIVKGGSEGSTGEVCRPSLIAFGSVKDVNDGFRVVLVADDPWVP